MIPRYDPTYQFSDLITALRWSSRADIDATLCAQLKRLTGAKHVFLFESARIALFALLKAYDRPGGVLMPAYTCVVVPEAVDCAGYHILYCLTIPRTVSFFGFIENCAPKLKKVVAAFWTLGIGD